jgi:uncharacterized membrane protein
VGDPFQRIIPRLKLGKQKTLVYKLLKKELEDVTIELSYLNKKQSFTVFLKKEATHDLPTVSSTQYAQQGQLGTKIKYDLTLERLAKSEQSFSLIVLNLPKEFPFAFIDPGSEARITNIKFTEQISKQSLDFELTIPEKLDQSFIEKSVEFTIVVCTQQELKRVYEMKRKIGDGPFPPEEIIKIKGNKAQLILIPKGAGKLEIIVPNLFKEVKKGADFRIKFTILNSGTMEMRKVTPVIDFPLEWEGTVEPKVIDLIEAGQKALVTLDIEPPSDVAMGEYTVKLEANGYSGVETVEAIDKNFTVRVSGESNVLGTVILVIILIGLVGGIAAASIKIARR